MHHAAGRAWKRATQNAQQTSLPLLLVSQPYALSRLRNTAAGHMHVYVCAYKNCLLGPWMQLEVHMPAQANSQVCGVDTVLVVRVRYMHKL